MINNITNTIVDLRFSLAVAIGVQLEFVEVQNLFTFVQKCNHFKQYKHYTSMQKGVNTLEL